MAMPKTQKIRSKITIQTCRGFFPDNLASFIAAMPHVSVVTDLAKGEQVSQVHQLRA